MAAELKPHKYIRTQSQLRMFNSFPLFLFAIWRHLKLPKPTWVQLSIAAWLAHGPRRRICEAFRGVGKSWITAAYVLWLLYRDPNHRILVVSASQRRADAFSVFCKRLIIEVDFLKFLEPSGEGRASNIEFDVGPAEADQSPSVKSVGITGQLAGSRAMTIIADDVEVPKNSYTELGRERLSEAVKEFDAVLKPGGEVVYLGTPQTEQSLYNVLLERGYVARIWPSEFIDGVDPETGEDIYRGMLAPDIRQTLEDNPELKGTTTEPERFSDIDLAERRLSYGPSGYELQFLLNTTLTDALRYPLKQSDFIVMDLDPQIAPVQVTWASGPEQRIEGYANVGLNGDRFHAPMYVSKDEWLKYEGKVLFIDPSGRGSDETAYAVTGSLNGFVYVLDWGGIEGGYEDPAMQAIVALAKKWKVDGVYLEDNFGDGMFTSLLRPHMQDKETGHPCHIEEYHSTGQKELRIIDKLEPPLAQHRIVLNKAVIEKNTRFHEGTGAAKSGLYQLTHLTKDRNSLKHDDRVEVLAEAVGHWTQSVVRDAQKAESIAREKAREQALKDFVAESKGSLLGGKAGLVTKFADGVMERVRNRTR